MSNDVSLVELRVFADVATTGSFTEAAIRNRLPPSSASRHVAALERKLGQRLLFRHTRAVRLTEAGITYLAEMRPALDILAAAADRIAGRDSAPSGLLRVNAPVAFGTLHVAPFLFAFQAQFPAVQVDLTLTDALIDPVAEGADIVLRIGRLKDSSLTARLLWPQRHVLAAAPDYLARRGVPRSAMDLDRHDALVYVGKAGPERWHLVPPDGRGLRIDPPGRLRSNHAETLLNAAIAGQGIVLFPSWLTAAPMRDGRLVAVLPDHTVRTGEEATAIHAIVPENRLRSARVASFLQGFIDSAGRAPVWDAP